MREACIQCGLCEKEPKIVKRRGTEGNVFFVGISNKENTLPFDEKTVSGKILAKVEERIGKKFYKTNLVKGAPISNGKLRYPTTKEKEFCFHYLLVEIEKYNPKVIFCFGKEVSKFLSKKEIPVLCIDMHHRNEKSIQNG